LAVETASTGARGAAFSPHHESPPLAEDQAGGETPEKGWRHFAAGSCWLYWYCQPVDISFNRPFKDMLKEEIDKEFEGADNNIDPDDITGCSAVGGNEGYDN
jgi:hypothetical protein